LRRKRYNPQTLEVLYNDKSIGDVMQMTIEEAAEFFSAHPKSRAPFVAVDTGLGYEAGKPKPDPERRRKRSDLSGNATKRGVSRAQ